MTHTVLKITRVWTQETEGGFMVKGICNGKTYFLKKMFRKVYDFVQDEELATIFKEATAARHVTEISKDLSRGKCITYLLTDNRYQADLLFVMLINGNEFGGIFDRAERAEEAVKTYNEANGDGKATYMDITDAINTPFYKGGNNLC